MEGGVGISSGEDRISSLPEELLCLILDSLTLKDVVRTSVLSSRWRNVWLRVSRLELNISDFPNQDTCVSFLDKFHNGSNLSEFKLNVETHVLGFKESVLEPCLSRFLKHKIQRFEFVNGMYLIPLTLSVCEALKLFPGSILAEETTPPVLLPCCMNSSLECVGIKCWITERATELKLVRYFLENSSTIKNLALHLKHESGGRMKHEPGVLKQLFEIPRRSSLCQFVILETAL
ncbi:PREDICTED: FBD-associated F-box protein At5g18780-like [Camelina sativa]|uniref:FBD-associated F-box protein At5g18780-like n=1 Tax=Camelina sativa TaxID=90675 RepID=A0ABM0Y4E8_CAMSA|nr:PREDICTED: FBD-associated F-box protein At5g18780-like [Camelina sativa]